MNQEQRDKIARLEAVLKQYGKEGLGNFHHFDHGVYQRGGTIKAGTVATGAVHLAAGVFVLAKGTLALYTEDGVEVHEAPWCTVTQPLTKRVMYAVTDCVLIAILETDETTPEAVEARYTVPDYEALEHINQDTKEIVCPSS